MTQPDRPLFTDDTGTRDAAWVRAALSGDPDAFGRLVSAYQRVAVSTAYRLLGNSEDAAETAQEAFLRAYRALDRLKDPARFGPWLLRAVTNLALNARRSRRRTTVALDEERGTEDAADTRGASAVTSMTPDREAEGHELQQALDAALEALPEKQRMALILFTIEGWAQKDIAELLECSVETVKWNVFQARKKLRDRLGDMIAD
ncbi:MAG TPA: sigma-70 family RNA polymerase sigma factor [Phycisphaerae bacterium]|nr:sigma-70 family RNA polymerase sigma factor [Phycisphaerae bacterium]HRR85566.1 sigma-70 family RNA polymerase sigma factor [Phycisphaerae bacterium]